MQSQCFKPAATVLSTVLLLLLGTSAATALDVTSCGATLGDDEIGDLVGDLECGPSDFGITLGTRALLRLNGFELRGRQGAYAVRCTRRSCTVIGPGRIAGAEIAIGLDDNVRLDVHNLELDGNDAGILGEQGPQISGGNSTVRASNLTVRNSTVIGINAGLFVGRNVRLEDNLDRGLWARVIRGSDYVVTGNGLHGLDARGRISVANLQATGNGGAGVHCEGPVSLRSSTLAANGPLDLVAERGRLKDTVCGTSNLGLCTDD